MLSLPEADVSIPAYRNGDKLRRLPHRHSPLSLPNGGSELNAGFSSFNAESAGGGREHLSV